MHRLKHMKECLISCVENQIAGNLKQVNTQELGAAIDMIKDLEEAIYYHTITKAMHDDDDDDKNVYEREHSPHQRKYHYPYYDYEDMNSEWDNKHHENDYTTPRDPREGASPKHRRMYMEGKSNHEDAAKNLEELEKYLHELSNDIMEMIEDSTPEEKQVMRQKITSLATRIK